MTNDLINITNGLIKETFYEYFRPVTGLRNWFKTNFVSPFYKHNIDKSHDFSNREKAMLIKQNYCAYYKIDPLLKDLILDEYRLSRTIHTSINSRSFYSYYFKNNSALFNLAFFEKERMVTEKFVFQFDSVIKHNQQFGRNQDKVLRIIFAHEFTTDLQVSGLLKDIQIDQLRQVTSSVDNVRYDKNLIKELESKEVNSFIKDIINIYSALFKILMFNFSVRNEESRYGVMPTSQRVDIDPYYVSLTENSNGVEDILIAQTVM